MKSLEVYFDIAAQQYMYIAKLIVVGLRYSLSTINDFLNEGPEYIAFKF